MLDRSEISRALAKAIAHKAVNNHAAANEWARKLVELLECNEILAVDHQTNWTPESARQRIGGTFGS